MIPLPPTILFRLIVLGEVIGESGGWELLLTLCFVFVCFLIKVSPAANTKEGMQVTIQGEPADRLFFYFVDDERIPEKFLEGLTRPKQRK